MYRYQRRYAGPVQAVIFDWAGTLVDFGSFAPTRVLIDAFSEVGIDVTLAQAREPMGLAKWDHIAALGRQPAIDAQWRARFGRAMAAADVDAVYARFMPMQIAHVARFSAAIPGAAELLQTLKEGGVRSGSCSGYPRAVMAQLLPHAAAQGVAPEHAVAADDFAAGGRPGPWMALANVIALGVADVRACVKVDDTVPGIEEGLAAGMWTVGVALSGNLAGLTHDESLRLTVAQRAEVRARAAAVLHAAGAHFVVDTVADLPQVLADIDARLAQGEAP